jgi:UDP-glucose 4-epimerase
MKILVVGGAGFIGSHMVKLLHSLGYDVVVFDNLSTGYESSVGRARLIIGDLKQRELLDKVFMEEKFDAVFHFASKISVSESISRPDLYYYNNVICSVNLLDSMVRYGVNKLVFSSTAAIFGNPVYLPIDEKHPKKPLNPYGNSKLVVEKILEDYYAAFGIISVSLRYFNAAGCDPDCELGEKHEPETHLIPLILRVASGRNEKIKIYGNDYKTNDGTCIRDYVHVVDLCQAHILALKWILHNKTIAKFNLGNGLGFSVLEVINACSKVTGKKVNFEIMERRLGDPDVLIANSENAKRYLGWSPLYSDLETIVQHAWNWELKSLSC